MTKARLALSGVIICLIVISMTSADVGSLTTTAATTTTTSKAATTTAAPPSYPACDTVPSYSLKGQSIDMYGKKSQKVNSKDDTFYRDNYRAGNKKTPWSKWSLADQNAFLSDGTTVYLFIDGKPMSLKKEICYDKNGKFYQKTADTVYKMFYFVIPAGTYTGKHYFFIAGFWNGQYDTSTGKYSTVTFT